MLKSGLLGGMMLLLLVGWCPVSQANSGYSIRSLLVLCIETVEDEQWQEYLAPSCEHYIKGWLDAMGYFVAIPASVCVPDTGFDVQQISREFVRWAVFHPEQYELPANEGVAATIKELYNCN